MEFWRIAKQKYALDKKCAGAEQHGGRWNSIGQPALYAGCSIEIAALEKFVHLNGVIHGLGLLLVKIEVPDNVSLVKQEASKLPKGWDILPSNSVSQNIGDNWLKNNTELVMLVPSVIIPEAFNAVINPNHSEYSQVTLSIYRPFEFDDRMKQ